MVTKTTWIRTSPTSFQAVALVVSKNVMIEGIPQIDEYGSGNAFVNPNMDAVGEVQVVASGFTAENGCSNGGLVNFVRSCSTIGLREVPR